MDELRVSREQLFRVTRGDQDATRSFEALFKAVNGKQDLLVSGVNIKTIGGLSILGSGNISIEGGSGTFIIDDGDAGIDGDFLLDDGGA